MFAVITDDLTGAAEIAGIAFSKGFNAVIETHRVEKCDADVLVVATNMRQLDKACAAEKSAKLTREILDLGPDFIFKKVDSVLRGNIGPELEAQMQIENKQRALLVPANPSRHRTIENGIYYVGDEPVAESGFASNHDDSVAPTSRVVDILLSRGTSSAICLSPGDAFLPAGLHIGNTRNADDMSRWAIAANDELVPAGAADFFAAILDERKPLQRLNGAAQWSMQDGRALYVCGSNFPASRSAVLEARSRGACVSDMPSELYYGKELDADHLHAWGQRTVECLKQHRHAIVAATHGPGEGSLKGRQVTKAMASVCAAAVKQNAVDDILIEGGATAQAVIDELHIDSLQPTQTLIPGVTRMKVEGYPALHIIMKPGSYSWPESVWNFSTRGAD